jgi:citrate synthase
VIGDRKGPELLRRNVGKVRSRVGGCFIGSHVMFRDKDLHAELGDASWFEVYLYGITGRRFSQAELRLLDALWAYTSYPDTRIWNNRVAALAGTARSTANLGVSAALAVSEASIYGRGIDVRASEFLIRTRAEIAAGAELAVCVRRELTARRSLAGYGRPVSNRRDERLDPMLKLARSLGLADGPHVALAHDIERYLLESRLRMSMNYGALGAALTADLGLSTREHYLYLFASFLAGMPPCYLDAAERPARTLLPLPCDGVAYKGAPHRAWPKR